ncbi:MAG: ATP-binding protein [Reyranellaceae bacterium]
MATLHFICGKAGAGKTTLARSLGASLPAVVLCEDEWVSTLGFEIASFEDFVAASRRCRAVMRPLIADMLRLGLSVVLDFAGNTPGGRQWVRDLAQAAAAHCVLHVIEASDAQCLANIHRRNVEKPPGIYWGPVADEMFHAATAYFVPPTAEEGFEIVAHPVAGSV